MALLKLIVEILAPLIIVTGVLTPAGLADKGDPADAKNRQGGSMETLWCAMRLERKAIPMFNKAYFYRFLENDDTEKRMETISHAAEKNARKYAIVIYKEES